MQRAEELFALTLTDAINEVARQGWEYVRAEHLPAEAPRGWFRARVAGEQTVLVFRRAARGARAAARRGPPEPPTTARRAAAGPPAAAAAERRGGRPDAARACAAASRRLRLEPPGDRAEDAAPTPLRPAPRLGPAEKP